MNYKLTEIPKGDSNQYLKDDAIYEKLVFNIFPLQFEKTELTPHYSSDYTDLTRIFQFFVPIIMNTVKFEKGLSSFRISHTYNLSLFKEYLHARTNWASTGIIFEDLNIVDDPYLDIATELPAVAMAVNADKAYKYNNYLIIQTRHRLQMETIYAAILMYFSIFKDKTYTEIPDNVYNFIKGYHDNDLKAVNDSLKSIINYDLIRRNEFEKVKDCFQNSYDTVLKNLESKLTKAINNVEYFEKEFAIAYNAMEKAKTEYDAMAEQERTPFDPKPIVKSLIKSPYITDIKKLSPTEICLYYEAPIKFYDKNIVKRNLAGAMGSKADFYKVFLSDRYELWTRSAISFNTSTYHIVAIRADSGSTYYRNAPYIPHPHLGRFGCQGNHPDAIREYKKNNDYIGCFQQISYMTMELNFTDYVVINDLFTKLKNNNNMTFKDTITGESLRYKEVVKNIRKEEKENEKDKTE